MAKPGYNFVDATFFFFQTFGRRPGAALWIMVWQIILYAGISVLLLLSILPFFGALVELAIHDREPSEAEILAALTSVAGGYVLAMIAALFALAMIQGAWLRLLARDELAPIIPLRFGMDELRLVGVNFIFFVFLIVGLFAFSALFTLINGGFVVATLNADDGAGVGLALTAGLLNVVLGLAVTAVTIFLLIRFAAAPALTIREKRFRLFESFSATRGIVAWMFVSYLFVFAMAFVGGMVVGVLQWAFALIAVADLAPTLSALENTEDPVVVLDVLYSTLTRPLTALAIGVIILIQLVFQIIVDGSLHGIGAYAARREVGDLPDDRVVTPSASVGQAPGEG